MSPQPSMIQWPALVHHPEDPELVLCRNILECIEIDTNLGDQDRLIDCTGQLYQIDSQEDQTLLIRPTGEHMNLDQVLGLIKAHLANEEACCVSKLQAANFNEAFDLIDKTLVS